MTSNSKENRKPVGAETLLTCLTGFCDGAKRRDGSGFNKADAQEGARLTAMSQHGIAWTNDDYTRALKLLSRYAKQTALGFSQDRREAAKLERRIRGGFLQNERPLAEKSEPFNYMHISAMGTKVYLITRVHIDAFDAFLKDVTSLKRVKHGTRSVWVQFEKSAYVTINGKREKVSRWVVDLNETTRPLLLELAKRWGFVVDPALERAVDQSVDSLARHERYCFLYQGVRKKLDAKWVVFDLSARDQDFIDDVKTNLKGYWHTSKQDDWNWFVRLTPESWKGIRTLIRKHQFKASPELCVLLMRS